MAAIKKFFEKRKLDVKFKQAGSGQKLTAETKKAAPSRGQSIQASGSRAGPSNEAQMAAAAALTRLDTTARPVSAVGTSAASIKAQAKRELEAERKASQEAQANSAIYGPPKEVFRDRMPGMAVDGIFYKCPLAGPAVLPKGDMEDYIEQFLWSQLGEEPEMTSALMIQTFNKDREKITTCIDILCKYIDNIVNHPGEEKYRKIRIQNRVFQEKVAPYQGTQEFLQAVGFEQKNIPGPQEIDEDYYIIDADFAKDSDRLLSIKDVLRAAEAVKPELDRNVKVFYPSPNATHMEVPEEFYSVSAEELKREQQLRKDAVERLGMLRTKEMREREQLRELRRYRFCLIRIRFPDGIMLQGTFKAHEKLSAVREFITENLENDWMPFIMSTQTGHRLTEENLSLAEIGLAPASIVNFAFDSTVLAEVTAQQGTTDETAYLRAELKAQARTL